MRRKFEMPLRAEHDGLNEDELVGKTVQLIDHRGVGQWTALDVRIDRVNGWITIWCDDDE